MKQKVNIFFFIVFLFASSFVKATDSLDSLTQVNEDYKTLLFNEKLRIGKSFFSFFE